MRNFFKSLVVPELLLLLARLAFTVCVCCLICVLLQPNNYPGNCWSFPGNQGETVVRLAKEIIPRAVTIQHISKKVSPTGDISSAPKDFAIYVSIIQVFIYIFRKGILKKKISGVTLFLA